MPRRLPALKPPKKRCDLITKSVIYICIYIYLLVFPLTSVSGSWHIPAPLSLLCSSRSRALNEAYVVTPSLLEEILTPVNFPFFQLLYFSFFLSYLFTRWCHLLSMLQKQQNGKSFNKTNSLRFAVCLFYWILYSILLIKCLIKFVFTFTNFIMFEAIPILHFYNVSFSG